MAGTRAGSGKWTDVVNCGLAVELRKGLSWFAQGDYMRVENDHRDVLYWHKARAWAAYTGINYRFPHGANLEAGWRHEEARYRDRAGYTHTEVELDTLYAHIGFYF